MYGSACTRTMERYKSLKQQPLSKCYVVTKKGQQVLACILIADIICRIIGHSPTQHVGVPQLKLPKCT